MRLGDYLDFVEMLDESDMREQMGDMLADTMAIKAVENIAKVAGVKPDDLFSEDENTRKKAEARYNRAEAFIQKKRAS